MIESMSHLLRMEGIIKALSVVHGWVKTGGEEDIRAPYL